MAGIVTKDGRFANPDFKKNEKRFRGGGGELGLPARRSIICPDNMFPRSRCADPCSLQKCTMMEKSTTLGVVSFLNSRPLIYGLEAQEGIRLLFDVPSKLPALLTENRAQAALVPVIEAAREGRQGASEQ